MLQATPVPTFSFQTTPVAPGGGGLFDILPPWIWILLVVVIVVQGIAAVRRRRR